MRSSPSETRGQFRGSYLFHRSEELAFMNRTGSGVVLYGFSEVQDVGRM